MDNNTLIIGIDLSFKSTGITLAYLDGPKGKYITMHRLIFDEQKNKSGKKYKPSIVKNIENLIYKIPSGLSSNNLSIDNTDTNSTEQIDATMKALSCNRSIRLLIEQAITEYKPSLIVCSIENYIMPSFAGNNQLKTVGGLIMLQSFVRETVTRLAIENKIIFKFCFPTPSRLKLFFTGSGKSEKLDMLKSFLTKYKGHKLLPTVTENDLLKVNDVIDSFALMMYGYSKYLKYINNGNNL